MPPLIYNNMSLPLTIVEEESTKKRDATGEIGAATITTTTFNWKSNRDGGEMAFLHHPRRIRG